MYCYALTIGNIAIDMYMLLALAEIFSLAIILI